ncbi:MAG: serine/threonine protein kinase [Gammaproteobacteria bacterium]|nr:serine/threonine protein kinase [Gammaproteobacteria bacterium]
MRKFGLIAAIVGFAILAADLLLRLLAHAGSWLWLPGFLALAGGSALVLWSRRSSVAPVIPAPKATNVSAGDTARLLDNFEQRFAELKGRKPSATVLGDLYALGTQLEQRGRAVQATAVYRHLARIDNTYRDVSVRLKRLMDAERAKPKAAPAPAPAPEPPTLNAVSPAPEPSAEGHNMQRLGRYQLEREIGRGAMGTVYLGRDTAINRLVAIKAIPLASEFSDSELEEARSRFFREAETAGRLNHPNIVTIYDVGEERGLAYIAMEYLKGRHLSDYATSNNLLEPRKVLEVIGRTAEALGFAHKQQVVHRDIKPANLMFDASTDVLKITDFGIARLSGAGSTRTGIVLGTPSFMSPEQLEGRTVTGHSDLFSLGVSLFQLLTGQLPFTADSMTGLMQQIAEAPHPPLRAFRPDLPACVESVVDRALAKNPDARFDSGAQMAAALEDCRSRIPSGLP